MIAGLWIGSILLALAGIVLKILYRPAQKAGDFFLTVYFLLTLFIQLAAFYFTAQKTAFGATLAFMLFLYYWLHFAPFYSHSDAAGNGMARGFRSFYIIVACLIWGIISFLLIKFLKPNGVRVGLYIVCGKGALIGLYNIFKNRQSFLSGDTFEEDARWACMHVDDYRKSLFRKSMVEKNDSWEAKELDAVPKELEHWNVAGCNLIDIKTYGLYPCILLEGSFELKNGPSKIRRRGFICGCLGYADGEDGNDETAFVPKNLKLVWHDLAEGKTYKIETELPKDLDRYFADIDRFRFDNIELRIMPTGRVLMFHNRFNQIHNIMLDYPLQGEVTGDYEKAVADYIQKENIDLAKCTKTKVPSAKIINDYQKRFSYHISFKSLDKRFEITKTICNFFNGEKILSGGTWEEKMDPSRIKDLFLRFENEQGRYACFVYLDEEEVLNAFEVVFENSDDGTQAEFTATVGKVQSDFSFTLKLGDKHYELKKSEIRLYKVNEDEKGKIVFKSYTGVHKNILRTLLSE
ncbi:MAG: hypothetical protein J6Y16_02160 [Treponema sp.]|nr:hypothetical protein [Treponema sp.]